MRVLRMFGLAAATAVAAMAFLGASSAYAEDTTLCKSDPASLPCPAGDLASHVHFVDPAAQLLTDIIDITCEALLLGDVTNPTLLGNPLIILGSLVYNNCNNGCTAKQTSADITVNVLKLGHELADVTGKGEVLVVCGFLLHCVYDGSSLLGHGLGPLLATGSHVTYKEAGVNSVSGLLCPDEAFLDALFKSLETLYIKS